MMDSWVSGGKSSLLVQGVGYDGEKRTVSVTFHPAGIKMLSREFAEVKA